MTDVSLAQKCTQLDRLAKAAIARLRLMPQPVVRVSGPLTSGGYGMEENKRRFVIAQEKLRAQGYTVFDYFDGNDDETAIANLEFGEQWPLIMDHYHYPIMATLLITTVFMMPKWRESNGAKGEYAFAKKHGIKTRSIPASWFAV